MGLFHFPRAARLLKSADFVAPRRFGKRIAVQFFDAEFLPTAHKQARLGMAVSRRVSKLAVIRNRIKRQLRESFRHQLPQLPPYDVLIIARSNAAKQDSQTLREDINALWTKLALKLGQSPGTMRAGL